MTDFRLENDVENWIESMKMREKIYQMAQIDISLLFKNDQIDYERIEHYFGTLGVGSLLIVPFQKYREASEYRNIVAAIRNVTNVYGRPPVLVGIDSVHGANYIKNAVFLPQQLNIAATWSKEYSKYSGMIAARDSRAAGIPWIFSPIVGLGIQPLWSRMFETFGEDPYVVSTMATSMIEGIQTVDENIDAVPRKSAACAKHFIGYSSPRTGHDRSPSWLPVRHLYQYFVPPWRSAIQDSNVMTVMESYSEYDGVPNVVNRESLRHLLREQLGFNGVLVTDYHEIENLIEFHHIAENNDEAISLALSSGSVDISMIPFNLDGWVEGVSKFVKMDMSSHENRNGFYV
jgi:beta-glucosidase